METFDLRIFIKKETTEASSGYLDLKDVSKYRLTPDGIYKFYMPYDSKSEYCAMQIPRENVNYIRRFKS